MGAPVPPPISNLVIPSLEEVETMRNTQAANIPTIKHVKMISRCAVFAANFLRSSRYLAISNSSSPFWPPPSVVPVRYLARRSFTALNVSSPEGRSRKQDGRVVGLDVVDRDLGPQQDSRGEEVCPARPRVGLIAEGDSGSRRQRRALLGATGQRWRPAGRRSQDRATPHDAVVLAIGGASRDARKGLS